MMNEKMIEKLTAKGFNRWTKGKYDRLYINAKDLGLECEYYKTGNIADAKFQGEGVSNSEAYRMKSAKTYIDVNTEEVSSTNRTLEEAAAAILAEIKAKIEAEEVAEKETEEVEMVEETEAETEMIVRVREYSVDANGDFYDLTAKDAETAKAEAVPLTKAYIDGFYDITVFRKTKHSVPCANGRIELFESVARMDNNWRWAKASGETAARSTLSDGRRLYEIGIDAEEFKAVAKKYA